MAHIWRGICTEYADRLGGISPTTVVTLGEGGTPLVRVDYLSELARRDVFVKVEGCNPTGSFKDRGMTLAITRAREQGAQAVICASTGNTSASAAAYAVAAGMTCAVLIPDGRIATGKLAQAIMTGCEIVAIDGNFDDCLSLARTLSEEYRVALVNSVNPDRILGQQSAAWEIVDQLGDAPDTHILPVGNAGNITAYWAGYREDAHAGRATRLPRMLGYQACGAAPFVAGHPIKAPDTVATAIRIGNPASYDGAVKAASDSGGRISAVTDAAIMSAHRELASRAGIFVEPASAAPVAGLLDLVDKGEVPPGERIVVTVTGNGLKDPGWATKGYDGAEPIIHRTGPRAEQVADLLELAR